MPPALEQTHELKRSGAVPGNKAMRPHFAMKLRKKGQAEMRLRPVARPWLVDPAASRIPGSMAKSYRLRYALPLGVATLFAYPVAALSQAVVPSQVTPQTLRPAAPSPPGSLDLSGGARLQTPVGTAALSLIVGRLVVVGGLSHLDNE